MFFFNADEAVESMEKNLEDLKIVAEQWLNQGTELVQQIPPNQLYAAIGVLLFTIIFFFSSK